MVDSRLIYQFPPHKCPLSFTTHNLAAKQRIHTFRRTCRNGLGSPSERIMSGLASSGGGDEARVRCAPAAAAPQGGSEPFL